MATNELLPFATANTNVLTQAEYSADSQRTSGNVPGVASSKLVNKAARQAAYAANMIGQFVVDGSGQDVLDDGNAAVFLANYKTAVGVLTPGRLLNVQTFKTPGASTYTPTPGVKFRVIEVLAGGGQGGGAEFDTVSSTMSTAAGGGAGAYGVLYLAGAATSVTVTVGAGGTGATTGTGVSGGSSSFGSLLTCAGGTGGQFGRSATIPTAGPTLPGGDGGATVTGATVGNPGAPGLTGAYLNAGVTSGMGGSTRYGAGGNSRSTSTAVAQAGNPGQGFGSGGSGAARVGVGSNQVGGAGAPGVVIVWEYS